MEYAAGTSDNPADFAIVPLISLNPQNMLATFEWLGWLGTG